MANLSTWKPFKRTERLPARRHDGGTMARRFEELFDELWRDPFATLRRPETFFGDFSPGRFTPTVDVSEDEKSLKVTAELPGLTAEDVSIDLEEGALVLRGEKREEHQSEAEGWYHTERSFGRFERVIPLPSEVDADKAEATFKDGVLRVTVPKVEAKAKARKIEVRPGA